MINRQEGYYSIDTFTDKFQIETINSKIVFTGKSTITDYDITLPEERLLQISGLEYPDIDQLMSIGIVTYYQFKTLI